MLTKSGGPPQRNRRGLNVFARFTPRIMATAIIAAKRRKSFMMQAG
jgi:hypothetical protein